MLGQICQELVLPWKRVQDRITITADFIPYLAVGEVIEEVESTVIVFQGVDPAPESILFNNPTFLGGVAQQKIYEGLPGVVYNVLIKVTTDLERVLQIVARQAVLLLGETPSPLYTSYFYTSRPYPQNLIDRFSMASTLEDTRFVRFPTPIDVFTMSTDLLGAVLFGSVEQTETEEYFTMESDLVDVYLHRVLYFYEFEDAFTMESDLISAVLFGAVIQYEFEDAFTMSCDLISAELT